MAKAAKGLTIGIDLGTTYSCVAVHLHNSVVVIPNEQGSRTTPSCVAFTEHDEILIGEAALNQMSRNPNNSVFDAKRLIGRSFSDECVRNDAKQWPFKVVAGAKDKPMIQVNFKNQDKQFSPEQISSMVLLKMKQTADKFIGADVKNAVITVPARFNDAQRKATKDAGTIAGLNVIRIINEPTAAAFAYGFNAGIGTKHILVFDAGGGTCDVSILRIKKSVFEVKATAGDTHLGGQDIDNRLVEHFVEEIKRKHKRDISGNHKALWKLKSSCEKAKRVLSSCDTTDIVIDSLDRNFDFSATLTRGKFEAVVMDILEKMVKPVEHCLNDANMSIAKIDDIVLVGGSARIPKLQIMLREMFKGMDLSNRVHPDEAVAHGAAVQAAILSGVKDARGKDVVLVDVTPLSLGVSYINDVMSVIIPRNTSIPCKMEQKLFTTRDNQVAVDIEIYEGERSRASDNNLLGEFTFEGIPPAPRGVGKVKTCFAVDADGILNVSVKEKKTGKEMCMTVDNDEAHLSKQEMERMLGEARQHKEDDDNFRKAMAAKNSLDLCVYHVSKMMKDLNLLSKFNAVRLNEMEEAIIRASL